MVLENLSKIFKATACVATVAFATTTFAEEPAAPAAPTEAGAPTDANAPTDHAKGKKKGRKHRGAKKHHGKKKGHKKEGDAPAATTEAKKEGDAKPASIVTTAPNTTTPTTPANAA